MEKEILLEGICAYVDERIANNEDLKTSMIVREYGLPETREYESFVKEYIDIVRQYEDQRSELIENHKSLNLKRLFWNSFTGGVAGGLFQPREYTAPAGAIAGLSLSLYDELKELKMDLSNVLWGVIGGGFVGSLAGEEGSYAGAMIGGILGVYKTVKDSRKNRETEKKYEHVA